jgi:hypothetical protein
MLACACTFHGQRALSQTIDEFQNWAIGMLQRAGAKEAKRRARELHLLIEGVNAMILISGDRTYADTAAAAAKRLLKQTGGSATAPEFHSV